jgi:hypothetical protein
MAPRSLWRNKFVSSSISSFAAHFRQAALRRQFVNIPDISHLLLTKQSADAKVNNHSKVYIHAKSKNG